MSEKPLATANDELADMLVSRPTSITNNLDQEAIVTSREKIELALHRNLTRYTTWRDVATSFGLVVALLTAFAGMGADGVLGVSSDALRGAIGLALLIVIVLLVRDIVRLWKRPTLHELVDAISSKS